jgi:hypothetical protein
LVESSGPPRVVVNTRSKSCTAWINCQIVTKTVTGDSCGHTTRQNVCHLFAPSMRAASIRSAGTSCSAAR